MLNVVHGAGAVVGEALVSHADVAAVSFTGSTAVGRHLQEVVGERRARVQLEMGGKNAYLVLDDADAESAAGIVAASAFGLTGQACTATSRVYVTPGIRDSFLKLLRERALRCARATASTRVRRWDRSSPTRSSPRTSTPSARPPTPATRRATPRTGRRAAFLRPVVFSGVPHESPIAREEVFGPVVAVVDVDDYEEGVSRVNDSAYGLTAGVCTRDLGTAYDFAARAQVGVVKVNRPTTGLDLNVPFGGVRDSSTNTFREQGARAVDFYTWSKSVYVGHDV